MQPLSRASPSFARVSRYRAPVSPQEKVTIDSAAGLRSRTHQISLSGDTIDTRSRHLLDSCIPSMFGNKAGAAQIRGAGPGQEYGANVHHQWAHWHAAGPWLMRQCGAGQSGQLLSITFSILPCDAPAGVRRGGGRRGYRSSS